MTVAEVAWAPSEYTHELPSSPMGPSLSTVVAEGVTRDPQEHTVRRHAAYFCTTAVLILLQHGCEALGVRDM